MKRALWGILLGLGSALLVSAAEPVPKSLDDQLLDDLSTDLAPAAKPVGKPTAKDAKAKDPALDRQLLDQLEGEDVELGPQPDPLTRISKQMRNVETLIGRRDTSTKTQEMQKQIVSELDLLLEQTKKQCQGGQCNKPPSPSSQASTSPPKGQQAPSSEPMNKPAKESSDELRKPGENKAAEDAAMDQLVKEVWGHLPEKVRNQMQNVGVEQFLPKYEKLIEAYYKRLAEEE